MCGIAGFTRFNSSVFDNDTLVSMGNAIVHRGPDADGQYMDNQIGLCHRRLSILDLSEAGNQPMLSPCGNHVLVFNGEIYNFADLRSEQRKQGYVFRTGTDTEVILSLYQKYGMEMLSYLNGMFAFALWDKSLNKLFLARDRIGKKPLYIYRNGKDYLFASEIKSLMTVPGLRFEPRTDAVYDFFTYQYVPDPKSIFSQVEKLPPAHYIEIDCDGSQQHCYWDVSLSPRTGADIGQMSEELYSLLHDATQLRMVSDVPLGAFLSGGIDSSGIVGLMAESSSDPVITCSIGFDSRKYDEVEYARIIASKFGTNHHEYTVREAVSDSLVDIARYFDEPFADQSFVPTYFVSKLARQNVTVALAGDGGDENFAGYQKYVIDSAENRIRQAVPTVIRNLVSPRLISLLSRSAQPSLRKSGSLLESISTDPGRGFFYSNAFTRPSSLNRIINESTARSLRDYDPADFMLNFYRNADSDDHLTKILYTDLKTFLPGDILTKVDRMSMANSLEVRAPLLDYRVVEFAASLPANFKLMKGDKKHILKKCFSGLLPHDIIYRKKMGFSVPLASWLRHEIRDLTQNTLFKNGSGVSNYFDMTAVHGMWQEHLSGKRDHSTLLWSMLTFELWWDAYMQKNPGAYPHSR